MISFTELLGCNCTALYSQSSKQLSFVASGRLSVLISLDGMVLLKLENFEYGINPNTQILYDTSDSQFTYVFYLKKFPEGHWILKINENGDSVFSCFHQKCYMKELKKNQFYSSNSNSLRPYKNGTKQYKKMEYRQKQAQENLREKPKSQENESMIVSASKGIAKGLHFTGKIISQGVEALGGFISQKTTPSKQVEVSEETKKNIKLAQNATGRVLKFTTEQVSALFKKGKEVAVDLANKFEDSDKGQQIKKKKYYDTIKEGTITGAKVVANLYDGVLNAADEIGSGTRKGAKQVIGVKYGKEAGQAADGMMQGAVNVGKIIRVPKNELVNNIK